MNNSLVNIAMRELGTQSQTLFPFYLSSLERAFKAAPPPYGTEWYGETYRQLATNPYWFIQSLISNAVKEASGAKDLWEVAYRAPSSHLTELVRKHAQDESRHCKLYVELISVLFPDALSPEQRSDLRTISPKFEISDAFFEPVTQDFFIDQLVQVNLGEFRTRIHQLLMRPVAEAICSAQNRPKLDKLLNILAIEEVSHLRYTAQLLESWSKEGNEDLINGLLLKRVQQFNGITMSEIGSQQFSVH
jgi:hypothetical protein